MSGRSFKALRRQVAKSPAVQAAAAVEQANAQSIARMEAWITVFSQMSFWRRMKWFVTGK